MRYCDCDPNEPNARLCVRCADVAENGPGVRRHYAMGPCETCGAPAAYMVAGVTGAEVREVLYEMRSDGVAA